MKYKVGDVVEWEIDNEAKDHGIDVIVQFEEYLNRPALLVGHDKNYQGIVFENEIIRKLTESEIGFWILTR